MRVLETGLGPIDGDEYLPSRPDDLFWGRLPCSRDSPVMSVQNGAVVTVDTVSHEGLLEDQGGDPVAFFGAHGIERDQILPEVIKLAADGRHSAQADGPHLVTGPIEVVGARPGDLLGITVVSTLRRVDYGVISARHGRGALPDEVLADQGPTSIFASVVEEADSEYGVLGRPGEFSIPRIPLAPFPGILGVATATSHRLHSVPPGAHGGNLDLTALGAGSTLYLPVQVPGAMAYVGDPHFAQGNGEVALTAWEAPLRVTLRFDLIRKEEAVIKFGEISSPLAETREHLIPTGLDEDLDVAVQNCVRAAIALLQARYGLSRHHAYAYLSVATDFEISQVVDLVKGSHALIRKADFAPRTFTKPKAEAVRAAGPPDNFLV